MRRIRTNELKAMAEEKMNDYDEAMIKELLQMIEDELTGMSVEEVNKDFWTGLWDNWSPDDEFEWASAAVQDEIDAYEDAKYEEMRDSEMGL